MPRYALRTSFEQILSTAQTAVTGIQYFGMKLYGGITKEVVWGYPAVGTIPGASGVGMKMYVTLWFCLMSVSDGAFSVLGALLLTAGRYACMSAW